LLGCGAGITWVRQDFSGRRIPSLPLSPP
jgi:hypothetical protein